MWGSAFITQAIYAAIGAGGTTDVFAILTENSLNILTEDGNNIDIEH
jgi:hypothetical protein